MSVDLKRDVNRIENGANGTFHAPTPLMTTMLEIPKDFEETIRTAAQQRGIQPEMLVKEAVERFLEVEGESVSNEDGASTKENWNPHGEDYTSKHSGATLPKPQYSNEGLSRQSGEDFDSPEIDRERSEATGEDF